MLHSEQDPRSSTNSMTPSVNATSQAALARLTRDTHRVTIQYRLTANSEHIRIIKKNISAMMLRACSGYCKDELDFDAEGRRRTLKTHTINIVGGNFSFLKIVFDFIVEYCGDKEEAMPTVQGSPLRFWGFVHEAAEFLQVSVLTDAALEEFKIYLTPTVTMQLARPVIQAFPLGTVYSDLVLDSLADSIVNMIGGWHPASSEYHQLGESENDNEIRFYQILKGVVDAELWERELNSQETGS